jgi:hypothetical protein
MCNIIAQTIHDDSEHAPSGHKPECACQSNRSRSVVSARILLASRLHRCRLTKAGLMLVQGIKGAAAKSATAIHPLNDIGVRISGSSIEYKEPLLRIKIDEFILPYSCFSVMVLRDCQWGAKLV